MSFGNLQLYGPEPSQGHAYGRSLARQGSPGRHTESAQQTQPFNESSAAFSGKSQTDLTVLTTEGDRITISLAAQVKYAASSQTGPGGSSQTVDASTSSQLRVAVQGDLNETELKDVGTLLSKLAQAGTPTSGQAQSTEVSSPVLSVPDASASNVGFAGLASLAAFAYSYKQTIEAGILFQSRA